MLHDKQPSINRYYPCPKIPQHAIITTMRKEHFIRFYIAALIIIHTFSIYAGTAYKTTTVMDPESRGEYLTIKVMTLGQGDPVYVWFGHIAIIVEDALTDNSVMFDYGVFDFRQENFYTNFAFGRLYYRAVASQATSRIKYALGENRDITILTLDIPPEKRYELYSYLIDNVKPENSTYLYHHYYNNCSTKIRDAIDMAVDGALKDWASRIPSEYTYREHIRRYTGNHYAMDFVLNFLQSDVIDRPISLWDAMFLPDVLESALLDFSYSDAQGRHIPLVKERQTIAKAEGRKGVPEHWTAHWPFGLLVGIIIGGIGVTLSMQSWRTQPFGSYTIGLSKHHRIYLGLYHTVIGLTGGMLGSLLLFMVVFTDHDVTYGNTNLLLCNPLMIIIGILGLFLMAGNMKILRYIQRLWIIMAMSGLALLFMRLFSIIDQQNQLSISVILPISCSMGLGPYIVRWITVRTTK